MEIPTPTTEPNPKKEVHCQTHQQPTHFSKPPLHHSTVEIANSTPSPNPTPHNAAPNPPNKGTKTSPLFLDPPPPDHPKIKSWEQISRPSLSLLRGLLALKCWTFFLPSICSGESSTIVDINTSVCVYLNCRRFVHTFRLHDPVSRERVPRDLMLLLLLSMWGSSSLLFRLPSKRAWVRSWLHSHSPCHSIA